MWLPIKDLAMLTGLSSRTIQKKVASGEIEARKKDKKSLEVDVSSLPEDLKNLLPERIRQESGSLTAISRTDSTMLSPAQSAALGRTLTEKEKKKLEIAKYYKALNPLQTEAVRAAITANMFSVSVATVRRYVKGFEAHGVLEVKKESKNTSWDPEAIRYLQGYYLSFLRDTNIRQKKPAWEAVKKEAEKQGWKIGCRASAYEILKEIPELMIKFALAGNRSLDNFFYIKRDWDSLQPSQVWIGDQHICDWWVIDKDAPDKPYRPVIYLWEDGATRMVAGLAVGHGSYDSDTVIESIRMGIKRLGFFEYTYNDNGTAECSKAATQIIDDLIILSNGRTQMKDISDLYRTEDGTYVVTDPETEEAVYVTDSVDQWRKVRRRIYANVKNAKAKPIERLFSTLEAKLMAKGLPGHVVTPGCPADQEEKEQHNLDKWIEKRQLLTIDEFIYQFVSVIDAYEHERHSSLGMSPWQKLQEKISKGWMATRPASDEELDFIFLRKSKARIKKGRVTINGIEYRGEDLKVEIGKYADVGLALHEGEMVDVRYDLNMPELAYAVFPSSALKIRRLTPVKAINMLDASAMEDAIRWKRQQMKVTRQLFESLVSPEGITVESKLIGRIEQANKTLLEPQEEENTPPTVYRKGLVIPLFKSDYEHYEWCLSQLVDGNSLTDQDLDFIRGYETRPGYEEEKSRWETMKRLGGLK